MRVKVHKGFVPVFWVFFQSRACFTYPQQAVDVYDKSLSKHDSFLLKEKNETFEPLSQKKKKK